MELQLDLYTHKITNNFFFSNLDMKGYLKIINVLKQVKFASNEFFLLVKVFEPLAVSVCIAATIYQILLVGI